MDTITIKLARRMSRVGQMRGERVFALCPTAVVHELCRLTRVCSLYALAQPPGRTAGGRIFADRRTNFLALSTLAIFASLLDFINV